MKYELIAVDLQNDFATEGGMHYRPRPSITFLKETLFPYLKEHHMKINEIISDYRTPRPGDRGKGCAPGTWGYESILPKEIVKSQWIKSMNSPLWTRDNVGVSDKEAGLPRQDKVGFDKWLSENIGKQSEIVPVVFGLTVDCCVLSTLQELAWHGYLPLVLVDGVDHFSGKPEEKEMTLKMVVKNWSRTINWEKLQKLLR